MKISQGWIYQIYYQLKTSQAWTYRIYHQLKISQGWIYQIYYQLPGKNVIRNVSFTRKNVE